MSILRSAERIRSTWLRRIAVGALMAGLCIVAFGLWPIETLRRVLREMAAAGRAEASHEWAALCRELKLLRRGYAFVASWKYHADRDAALEEAWAKVPGRRRR